uniref:Leucine-rich repeat-containing N-terminal plant-type domain-containing protein n=1 Tax=Salix viminalis TaxID=40686 RepID=A0A6N2K4M3_SALVM
MMRTTNSNPPKCRKKAHFPFNSLPHPLPFPACRLQFHDQEQAVLLRLKQHWQNPCLLNTGPHQNTSHCTWPEVVCTNNYITQLILDNKKHLWNYPPFLSTFKEPHIS